MKIYELDFENKKVRRKSWYKHIYLYTDKFGYFIENDDGERYYWLSLEDLLEDLKADDWEYFKEVT